MCECSQRLAGTRYKPTPGRVLNGSTTPTVETYQFSREEVDTMFHLRSDYVQKWVAQILPRVLEIGATRELLDFCTVFARYVYTRILVDDEGYNPRATSKHSMGAPIDQNKRREKKRRYILQAWGIMNDKRARLLGRLKHG